MFWVGENTKADIGLYLGKLFEKHPRDRHKYKKRRGRSDSEEADKQPPH